VPEIVVVGAGGELGAYAGITAPLPNGDAAERLTPFMALITA
jgi:hypothetical protein